ncbi:MAG: hypothetical protein O3C40_15460 [Planctomycetota bacterium]|nr:hypothetical protein [Planctomycetota bacterium]
MNLKEAFDFVAPNVRDAARNASAQLQRLGIRHALAGGLAVGAYGYIRNTADVDFLVGEEAFEHHGMLVTFKAGVPIEVNGIRVDYLSPAGLGPHMETVFEHAQVSDGLAVVPCDALIYMKLVANRRRDQLDVIELIRAGADCKSARSYLEQFASDLVPRYEALLNEALD